MITRVLVRYSSAAHNVRVGKQSASSTSSAKEAVERLAQKLYGAAVERVVREASQSIDPPLSTRWAIVVKETATEPEAA